MVRNAAQQCDKKYCMGRVGRRKNRGCQVGGLRVSVQKRECRPHPHEGGEQTEQSGCSPRNTADGKD